MIIVSPSQLNDSILLKLNGKLGLGNVIILFRKGSTHSFMYLKTCIHPCGWQLVPVIGLQWSLLLHMLKCLLDTNTLCEKVRRLRDSFFFFLIASCSSFSFRTLAFPTFFRLSLHILSLVPMPSVWGRNTSFQLDFRFNSAGTAIFFLAPGISSNQAPCFYAGSLHLH